MKYLKLFEDHNRGYQYYADKVNNLLDVISKQEGLIQHLCNKLSDMSKAYPEKFTFKKPYGGQWGYYISFGNNNEGKFIIDIRNYEGLYYDIQKIINVGNIMKKINESNSLIEYPKKLSQLLDTIGEENLQNLKEYFKRKSNKNYRDIKYEKDENGEWFLVIKPDNMSPSGERHKISEITNHWAKSLYDDMANTINVPNIMKQINEGKGGKELNVKKLVDILNHLYRYDPSYMDMFNDSSSYIDNLNKKLKDSGFPVTLFLEPNTYEWWYRYNHEFNPLSKLPEEIIEVIYKKILSLSKMSTEKIIKKINQ